MAVAYRSVGITSFANTASTVATLPAGLTANDLMLMMVTMETAGVTVTTPSGWTALSSSPTASGGFSNACAMWVYTRTAGASESAPTVSFSGAGQNVVYISAWSGCDPVTPVNANAVAVWTANNSSATYVFPSVTTTVSNCAIVLAQIRNSVGANAFTSGPSSYAQNFDHGDANIGGANVVSGLNAAAGATGTLSATYTSTMGAAGFTIALAPGAGSSKSLQHGPSHRIVSRLFWSDQDG